MTKNPFLVFFGIFLVSMLFVPPSIPFMVPEAEAAGATVTGQIWDDNNMNGVFDDWEGIGDVQVIVLNTSSSTFELTTSGGGCEQIPPTHCQTTSGGGNYIFSNLTPGEYTVSHEDPWPHLDRTRIGPESVSFVLSSDETKVVNFGMSCYFDCGAEPPDTTPPTIEFRIPGSLHPDNVAGDGNLNANDTLVFSEDVGGNYPPPDATGFLFDGWHLQLSDDVGGNWTSGLHVQEVGPANHSCSVGSFEIPKSNASADYGSWGYSSNYEGYNYYYKFPVGTSTVTCTASDIAGNVATAGFTVTVVYEAPADTTPPVVTINPNSSGLIALEDSDCWGAPQDPLPGNIFPMETLCTSAYSSDDPTQIPRIKPNWSSDFIQLSLQIC